MTTFAAHLIEAAWALRYLFAVLAVLLWFACRMVTEAHKLNARLDAMEAARKAEVATWHSDGRLKSVGGMEPGRWLAQAPRVRR